MDTPDTLSKLSISNDAREMLVRAREEGIETVWDRLAAQQPQCGYCSMGVSCRNCSMGPCRVDPFGEGPQQGVCGADADIIVARNLGRTIAAGAAAHSDHGRDILEVFESLAAGETSGYEIRDEAKLLALAKERSMTQKIQRVLYHPGFPVDVRHNAKIKRGILRDWATAQLEGPLTEGAK